MATALVLSGGGSRGDFEVGAVRYLYERVWPGGHPDIICGTSVGAINAAKLAEGAGGLDGLEAIWNGLRKNEDMYVPEPWFASLMANGLGSLAGQLSQDSTLTDIAHGLVMLANPAALVFGNGGLIDVFGAMSAAQDAAQAKSMYNLGPIQKKLDDPAFLDPAKIRASGIKLRLAMVGLVSGDLLWADENGALFARDGSPHTGVALDPACQTLQDRIDTVERQIQAERQQLVTDLSAIGTTLATIQQLMAESFTLRVALTTCMTQHPPVRQQLHTDVPSAVLASASIPGAFPPVHTADDWFVDGGVRAVLPVEAAVVAGATRIYAVAASRAASDAATPLLGGDPLDMAKANFLDIIKHAADDILPNEVMHADTDPPRGWGVPMTVIRPMADIHDGLTIDPGLIDIRVAEGYMRADDTLEAAKATVVDTFAPTADDYSAIRNTQLIVSLRHRIWEREGGLDTVGLYPRSVGPQIPAAPGQPVPRLDRLDELRDLKRQLRTAVQQRIAAGGAVPPGHDQWWLTWERHQWTPNQVLWDAAHPLDPPGRLAVTADPAKIPLGVPVEITVRTTDQATGRPVDGRVLVDGTAVAATNAPFVQVFSATTRFRIDPRTHAREPYDADPVVTAAAGGYTTAAVPCTFAAPPPGQPAPAPPRISLRAVNYATRYVRHQNFQGELTEIASDLDKRDGTFLVRPGLAQSALPPLPDAPASAPAPVPPHAPAPPSAPVPPHAPRGPVGKPLPHLPAGSGRLPRAFAAQSIAPGGPIAGGLLGRGTAGVSFESADYPGWFLCDSNGRLALEQRPASPTAAYLASATFRTQLGLAGTGMSFLSLNGTGRYLRHRDFHLYVEDHTTGPATFAADATFTVAPPWSPS